MTTHPISDKRILRLNVGHLLKQGAGTTRSIAFDEHNVQAGDIVLTDLQGKLDLTRTVQGILLRGKLRASAPGECVRCLIEAPVTFTIKLSEHFIHPPSEAAEDEPAVGDDAHIDLMPLVREETILALPMNLLCQPDCRGLCSQCGQNLNEAQCDCDHSAIDPRLAVLKALLDE